MIRVPRSQAQRLAVAVACISARGYSYNDALSYCQGGHLSREFTEVAREIASTFRYMKVSDQYDLVRKDTDEIAAAILSEAKVGSQDGQLIDLLANLLQEPYSGNILSGHTLTALRRSILLPAEVVGLESRLGAREIACYLCGTQLQHGEAGTIVSQSGGRYGLACNLCIQPSSIRCKGCRRSCALPTKLDTGLSRHECADCHAKRRPQKEGAPSTGASIGGSIGAPTLTVATATGRTRNAQSLGQRVARLQNIERMNAPRPPSDTLLNAIRRDAARDLADMIGTGGG